MFRHLLIPTDGSRLAAKGIKAGVRLAGSLGARVTGVYVAAPYMPAIYGEAGLTLTGLSQKEYEKLIARQAKKALAAVEIEAGVAGVPCRLESLTEVQPWRGILRVARSRKCDAIVMASHGRGGLGGLILGSETARVLAHSKVPVLVTR
jgi:nucleotide-binding universal stress UspA family protein